MKVAKNKGAMKSQRVPKGQESADSGARHRNVYDPERVREWREAARRDPSIIKPLSIYSRIEYECLTCGAHYMGDERHECEDGRLRSR